MDESEGSVWGLAYGVGKEVVRMVWPKPNPAKAKLRALKLPANHELVLARAREDLKARTAAHQGTWQIDQIVNWGLEQDEGILRLTRSDGVVACAFAQIIGSFNANDSTWMWSWANGSIIDDLVTDAELVRQYGLLKKIKQLTDPKCQATQDDCWDMTALATLLNGAQGAYRGPVGDSGQFLFMTFGDVKLVKAKKGTTTT